MVVRAWGDATFLTGSFKSGPGAFPKHGPFELGEGADHLHHHPSCGGGRVDGLGQAAESRAGLLDALHDREHVAKGAREPVQLLDDEHVTGPQLIEETLELGPVPTAARDLLAKEALASGSFEHQGLSGSVLVVFGDSGITEQHCIKVSPIESLMQYFSATPNPLKTRQPATARIIERSRNSSR